ncbi:MAG: glutamate racemase [Clostridiales bacterium]|nr:glutamate racemase [Clostridiales bacterium]
MERSELPVLFFDSGVGGISILRRSVRLLPCEDYLYFGDSLHAPYGVRSLGEVRELCLNALEPLIARGVKALVVACNTATSAAIGALRERYPDLIVIGTEPAIKPAVERHEGGRILVMATPMTLKEEKFLALQAQYQPRAEIIPLPCPGLMEFVEQGVTSGGAVEGYLLDKLEPYRNVPVSAIVLGCTHYPFLTGAIRRIVGRHVEIIDGADGVAQQLRSRLAAENLLSARTEPGRVAFENSLDQPEILELCRTLLNAPEE